MPSELLLHAVSVVITAESHNPSILNHNFLVSQGIVPSDWTPIQAITTPPVSVVHYDNGIQWVVDQQRLSVTEECESPFRENYRVHSLANKYVDKLSHVPYRSLGLNCIVSIIREQPRKWLTQRFLRPGTWTDDPPELELMPRFTVELDGRVLRLAFDVGKLPRGNGTSQENAVMIDCNLHHEGPLNSDDLRTAMGRWADGQRLIVSLLDKLLTGI